MTIDSTMNESRLREIHSKLTIQHGSFSDEYPEQLMAATFLTGREKVLELGGNIGRNSMIIGYILNQNGNNNFVTLETNADDAEKLRENRDANGLDFHIENAALSMRKISQRNGQWSTKVYLSEESLEDGHAWVNTLSWKELNEKYKIDFDTLVLDCEGAFYYIVQDMPEMLDNINMIIVENDYFDDSKKSYVDSILSQNGFGCIFRQAGAGYNDFYEVWKRNP